MLGKVPHPLDGVELMEDTMREAKHGVIDYRGVNPYGKEVGRCGRCNPDWDCMCFEDLGC